MASHAQTSCDHLMRAFQDRLDTEAFDQIVSRLLSPALGVARQLVGCHATAEDAVQEAFLRVVRNRAQYRPCRPFTPWFYTILRNVCVDMLRRRARQDEAIRDLARQTPEFVEPGVSDVSDALEWLRRLPCGERDVLVLRIGHDLPLRDVAAALGISEEAAKKRAQRGLRRLRARALSSAALHPGAH